MTTIPTESIRAGFYADINGEPHWLTIRGKDTRNPAMLIVGGPGAAMSAAAPFFAPWEEALTLIQWDAPGAGSTHAKHGDPAQGAYTLERLTRDAITVAEVTARRLDRKKLILLGISAGSAIGLGVAARRPDLLDAYVGCGQVVNWAEQVGLGYEQLLERARRDRDDAAIADLERAGPPPWHAIDDEIVVARYSGALTRAEQAALASLDPDVLTQM